MSKLLNSKWGNSSTLNNHVVLFEDDQFKFLISTRSGGFSKAPYDSLNLGLNTKDDVASVKKNRQTFFKSILPADKTLEYAGQVHKAKIANTDGSGYHEDTDGFFCADHGHTASITVADCYPVFLADKKTGVFSLLHMGWRGTTAGILNKALTLFKNNGIPAATMKFSIGPGIGFERFEIGPDVKQFFPGKYFTGDSGEKGNLDLGGFIIDQFINAGGQSLHVTDRRECTFENQHKYYSFRRDGNKSGRMLALAWNKNQE